jgi:hypothetical protein
MISAAMTGEYKSAILHPSDALKNNDKTGIS